MIFLLIIFLGAACLVGVAGGWLLKYRFTHPAPLSFLDIVLISFMRKRYALRIVCEWDNKNDRWLATTYSGDTKLVTGTSPNRACNAAWNAVESALFKRQ